MDTVVAPCRWDGHQLLTARPEQESEALARWADRGLRRGEKLLYAATDRISALPQFADALEAAGVHDVPAAAQGGRLAVVDPARFYSVPGYESLIGEAFGEGHHGARSFGGPGTGAQAMDADDLAAFEESLERMWQAHGVTAVCRYAPSDGAGDESLEPAVVRHTSGWGDRMLHATCPEPGRLRLVGEADTANDTLLAAIVAAAAARAGAVLVVDCTGLTFVSVGGWRALARVAEAFLERGRRIRLLGLPKTARTVLLLTGFAQFFDLDTPR